MIAVVAVAPLAIGVKYSVWGFGRGPREEDDIDFGMRGTDALAFA